MIDREKVIKGLEMCTADIPVDKGIQKEDFCKKCPYHEEKYSFCFEIIHLMKDALELLKEQEEKLKHEYMRGYDKAWDEIGGR